MRGAMRNMLLIAWLAAAAWAPALASDPATEAQAAQLRLQAAIADGDLAALAELAAVDFAYIDMSANRIGRDVVLRRRERDQRVTASETLSEFETIVLSPSVVLIRSKSESVAHYYGKLPRSGWGRDSMIWRKDGDGVWRIVHAQVTPGVNREYPVKERVDLPVSAMSRFNGVWSLEVEGGQTLVIRAGPGKLLVTSPGHFEDFEFFPEGPTRFFAIERPWELNFADDATALALVTWGSETKGVRRK